MTSEVTSEPWSAAGGGRQSRPQGVAPEAAETDAASPADPGGRPSPAAPAELDHRGSDQRGSWDQRGWDQHSGSDERGGWDRRDEGPHDGRGSH